MSGIICAALLALLTVATLAFFVHRDRKKNKRNREKLEAEMSQERRKPRSFVRIFYNSPRLGKPTFIETNLFNPKYESTFYGEYGFDSWVVGSEDLAKRYIRKCFENGVFEVGTICIPASEVKEVTIEKEGKDEKVE